VVLRKAGYEAFNSSDKIYLVRNCFYINCCVKIEKQYHYVVTVVPGVCLHYLSDAKRSLSTP